MLLNPEQRVCPFIKEWHMLDFPGKLAILTRIPEGPKPRAAWIKTGKRNDSPSPARAASPTPWEPPPPWQEGEVSTI